MKTKQRGVSAGLNKALTGSKVAKTIKLLAALCLCVGVAQAGEFVHCQFYYKSNEQPAVKAGWLLVGDTLHSAPNVVAGSLQVEDIVDLSVPHVPSTSSMLAPVPFISIVKSITFENKKGKSFDATVKFNMGTDKYELETGATYKDIELAKDVDCIKRTINDGKSGDEAQKALLEINKQYF